MTHANDALSSALNDQEIDATSNIDQIRPATDAERLKLLRKYIRGLVSKSEDLEFIAEMRYDLKMLKPIPEALDKHNDLFERAIKHWKDYIKSLELALSNSLRGT